MRSLGDLVRVLIWGNALIPLSVLVAVIRVLKVRYVAMDRFVTIISCRNFLKRAKHFLHSRQISAQFLHLMVYISVAKRLVFSLDPFYKAYLEEQY